MRKSKNVKGRSLTVPTFRRDTATKGKSRCDPERRQLHRLLFTILIVLLPAQLGRHFWPQWSYVLGLRVDYLSPTIYLTDILVLGILLSWIWGSLKTPRRLVLCPPKNRSLSRIRIELERRKVRLGGNTILRGGGIRKNWWIFAAFLFLQVNCFFAQNQAVSLYKFAKIIEFALLGLYVAKNHSLLITNCSITFSVPVIYSSLIALAQFLKQSSLNGVFYWLGERTFDISTPGIARAIIGGQLILRPYATFPHPNVLAGFTLISLILIFPITHCSLLITKTMRRLAMSLGVIAILISFSRSAWLVGLMIGFWWLMINLKISRVRLADQDYNDEKRDAWRPPRMVVAKSTSSEVRKRKRKMSGVLIAIYSLLITFFSFFLVFNLPFSTSEALSQRLQLSKAAIVMIKESPLIGVGLNNFLVRLPEFWSAPENVRFLQPVHNIFLLIAAETGLVGLLIFLWFLILTLRHLRGGRMDSSKVDNLITALSSILLLGLFDHYFLTLQQTQVLLSIVLGLSWGIDS